MEDTLNTIEDQPLPEKGTDDLVTANASLQGAVDELGQVLFRRLQMNGGQFNPVELEVRLFVAVEQVNVLCELLKRLLPGLDDAKLTSLTADRLKATTKLFQEQLAAAPRIALAAGAPPSKLNGSKHN
jgi:hypothetical protein